MKKVVVYDAQQNLNIRMEERRGVSLATKFPYRFTLVFVQGSPYIQEGQVLPPRPNETQIILDRVEAHARKNIMPQLPAETKTLKNGAHIVLAFEVKTTKGNFGDQEEITCMKEGTEELTRVWISHNARTKIIQARDAGLVEVHEDESWNVIIGARVQILVAGGKIVGLAKAPKAE
jgi:hypothetical protein